MKRALVTGAAGFVGRHMVGELISRGWAVRGVDTMGGPFAYPMDVHHYLRPGTPEVDLLVHCAFHVGGRKAIDGDKSALARNLALDAAVFDYAAHSGKVGRVLYWSSSAAYPVSLQRKGDSVQPNALRLVEEDAQYWNGPADADYGYAKLTGERMAANCRALGTPVTVVRPFSGYGEDQSLDYPFMSIMKRAHEADDPFVIWGDDTQIRDWIHIDDVVKGALAIVDGQASVNGMGDEPVNICTGVGISMRDLACLAWSRLYGGLPNIEVQSSAPMGVHTRVGDPTYFSGFYAPTVTLAAGIDRAIRRLQ